jgi:hypothetical protein
LKTSVAVSQTGDPDGGSRGVFPPEIVWGIHRYTRLYGAVYSVYRETTKKYIGLSLYDGKEFTPCTPTELIHAIHESKDRK